MPRSEGGRCELYVGSLPCPFKLTPYRIAFDYASLRIQRLNKPIQRPTIFRVLHQIIAVDGFGIGRSSCS